MALNPIAYIGKVVDSFHSYQRTLPVHRPRPGRWKALRTRRSSSDDSKGEPLRADQSRHELWEFR